MNNDLWNIFKATGSVFDYLNYAKNENATEPARIDFSNENNNQGLSNQGTNDRRE